MALFWPTEIRPDTTLLRRFGRVLHWFFAALALASAAGGLFGAVTAHPESSPEVSLGLGAMAFVLFWVVGRALRYVFSGE